MWRISFILNRAITGNHETICATAYRTNPNSRLVHILNLIFACERQHCKCAFNYWEKKKCSTPSE